MASKAGSGYRGASGMIAALRYRGRGGVGSWGELVVHESCDHKQRPEHLRSAILACILQVLHNYPRPSIGQIIDIYLQVASIERLSDALDRAYR